MSLDTMIRRLKAHPRYHEMGMIASHLGVVRATSRNGAAVKSIEVRFDREAVDRIRTETKEMPGIVEVLIETYEGTLNVGDEIMAVSVGGDIRPHVFPALTAAVDRMKEEAAAKKEVLDSGE